MINKGGLKLKRIKGIGYIIVIVIVMVLSLTIYTNASRNNEKNQKEKIFAEIKLVEGKIANLLNSMNNIEARNYSIVTSELSKATTEKSSSDNSSSKSGSSGSSSSSQQGSSSEQNSSDSSSQEPTEGEESQDKKKFELKSNGILTNTDEINWESIKSEVEGMYTSLPTITMDLYQSNVNQESVLAFNTQYDKVTNVVKDEKKQETLTELTNLYQYLPEFLRSSGQEELYTTLVETKYHIFKGYTKLEEENWPEISNDIKSAVDSYSKLLTNTNVDERKQYNISKGYIMLNELKKAVDLQDVTVFLIKYKNLLEEFNNI